MGNKILTSIKQIQNFDIYKHQDDFWTSIDEEHDINVFTIEEDGLHYYNVYMVIDGIIDTLDIVEEGYIDDLSIA